MTDEYIHIRAPGGAVCGLANTPHPLAFESARIKSATCPVCIREAAICRCCGKSLFGIAAYDGNAIHTSCIRRHWGAHQHGTGASRCREFRKEVKL